MSELHIKARSNRIKALEHIADRRERGQVISRPQGSEAQVIRMASKLIHDFRRRNALFVA